MLNSRKTELLNWKVQELLAQLEKNCAKRGVTFKIIGTVRDQEYQTYIYQQGRTRPGNIVTNAKFTSFHRDDVGLAFDLCPWVNSKLDWNAQKEYSIIQEEARKLGFTCGADWKSFPENAHFQLDGGLTSSQILAGKRPSWFVKPQLKKETPMEQVKDQIPAWAKEAYDWIVKNKISDGTRPFDGATRLELWVMLFNFAKFLKK